ncbi:hypothetical protein GCM10022224_044460 [Nonomuraea antimicrobica]|uniref:Uncharacterized protein n=1 Tax=Nonomuraea antimicrobica TaxID=561173 RepID=A0ABP7C3F4_9ACTN
MRRYRNGRVAAALAGVYACLVATLGVVSMVILLTVHDPILVSAVALMVVTFPLGPLIWWGWGFLPPDSVDPVWLLVALAVAGLLQAYLMWRLLRGPALHAP